MPTPLRILNLGGGQQSIAIYLLAANGEIPPLDYAIFADTGEEPAWVLPNVQALSDYRTPAGKPGAPVWVRWLKDKDGNRVRLGDQLTDGNAGRCAAIPAFVKHTSMYDRHGKNPQGKARRQCTREFKVEVVELAIRREILGLAKGEVYRGERQVQVFGYDFDEGGRIFRVKGRLAEYPLSTGDFPLWDLQWKRSDCVAYLAEAPGWGREVLSSACTFCPLVNQQFRRLVRDRDPAGHARACQVDHGLRKEGAAASKMMDGELYVHREMIPLEDVNLDAAEGGQFGFMSGGDCEGYCGH